jgi:hypothetical protein
MRLLKLFQEWGREDKGERWRGEFKYDIRTFVNVTLCPQYNNNKTIIIREKV